MQYPHKDRFILLFKSTKGLSLHCSFLFLLLQELFFFLYKLPITNPTWAGSWLFWLNQRIINHHLMRKPCVCRKPHHYIKMPNVLIQLSKATAATCFSGRWLTSHIAELFIFLRCSSRFVQLCHKFLRKQPLTSQNAADHQAECERKSQVWGCDCDSRWGRSGSPSHSCPRAAPLCRSQTECSCSTGSSPPAGSHSAGEARAATDRRTNERFNAALTKAFHWSQPGGIWSTSPAALVPYWWKWSTQRGLEVNTAAY